MAGEMSPPPEHGDSERYGPLVHRAVHHGAILLIVGTVQFIFAMAWVESQYGGYSLVSNYISDLGNTSTSPFPIVFNASILAMGLLLILAAIMIRTAFPARGSRTIGLGLLALAGLGAIGVGLSPENVNLTVHSVSALLAFAGGGLALIVLGFAMFRDTRWDGFRAYTVLSGLVALVALALFVTKTYLGLGVGGMERLIVAPILLWAIVVGIHLARIPTFAPRAIPKGTSG